MVRVSLLALAQAAVRASPRLRKAPVEITEAAAERVRSLLDKRDKVLTPPLPSLPPFLSSHVYIRKLSPHVQSNWA